MLPEPYFKTKLGKLYHGNCFELFPKIDTPIDLILTDPPYDKYTHSGGRFGKKAEFGNITFDCIENYNFIADYKIKTKRWIIIFCPVESLGIIQKDYSEIYVRGGIWDRVNPSPQLSGDRPAQACEGIAILHSKTGKEWNGGGKAGIWRYCVDRGLKRVHETQKPLALIKSLVSDFSFPKETIVDPFSGSGTLAVACEDLNRNWICIEKDESYCEKAAKRIEEFKKQGVLF